VLILIVLLNGVYSSLSALSVLWPNEAFSMLYIPSLPVGLRFQINTKSNIGYSLPIQGSLNVILSHYDGVPKTVEKSSESDIDINFPIVLK
jgi:hypothetical protein